MADTKPFSKKMDACDNEVMAKVATDKQARSGCKGKNGFAYNELSGKRLFFKIF